ncbi:hypothetical protein GCM10027614_14370 [Micromonospora vulcania]
MRRGGPGVRRPAVPVLAGEDPRPNGDQGNTPRPSASHAGSTSRSTPRSSSEYSTWAATTGARPGQAVCQAAARAVCQPEKFDTPTYRTRPLATA